MDFNNYLINGSWALSIFVWVVVLATVIALIAYRNRVRIFQRGHGRTQKSSWPWEPKEKGMKKYKELTDSTMIVIIAMILLAGYVGLWDFLMLNISKGLTHLAR